MSVVAEGTIFLTAEKIDLIKRCKVHDPYHELTAGKKVLEFLFRVTACIIIKFASWEKKQEIEEVIEILGKCQKVKEVVDDGY